MYNNNPDQLLNFGGLDAEIIENLIRRSFDADLMADAENLYFGLRYGYVAIEPDDGVSGMEFRRSLDWDTLVIEVQRFSGKRESVESISRVVEKAEAIVTRYVWDTVNHAVRLFLDDRRYRDD